MDAQALEAELTRCEREAKALRRKHNGNSPEDSLVRDHVRFFLQAVRDVRRRMMQGEDLNVLWAYLAATTLRSQMAVQTGDQRFIDHRIGTIAEVEYTGTGEGEQ